MCFENDRDRVKTRENRSRAFYSQGLTKTYQRLTKGAKSFHTVWTGFAEPRRHLLFLARRCCKTLLPFSCKWQQNIATTVSCQKTSRQYDNRITDVAIDQALRALSGNESEGRSGRARGSSATPVSPRPTTRGHRRPGKSPASGRLQADAGSYVSESNFFDRAWQRSFWGPNYPRLRAVRKLTRVLREWPLSYSPVAEKR
jgi:hypothetical protein